MGGAITIIGAVRIPELSAAVCFYGLPPSTVANPKDIRVPLQAHFANQDDWCTPKAVDDFAAAVKAAGKTAEIFRYDAKHGFMNEQRPEFMTKRRRSSPGIACWRFWVSTFEVEPAQGGGSRWS